MRARLRRAAPYAVVLAAAAALLAVAAGFEFEPRPGALGPDAWPKAILVAAVAVCVWQIAAALIRRDGASGATGVLTELASPHSWPDTPAGPVAQPVGQPSRQLVRAAAGMAATVAYVALVTRLGFFIATALYIASFLAIARYPRWGVSAIVSIGGTLVLMFVFMKLVYVSLPLGEGGWAAVMLFLMHVMAIR